MSKDIVEGFLYSTAKELRDELIEHFGECNGPMLYQIHRTKFNMELPIRIFNSLINNNLTLS